MQYEYRGRQCSRLKSAAPAMNNEATQSLFINYRKCKARPICRNNIARVFCSAQLLVQSDRLKHVFLHGYILFGDIFIASLETIE
jgi:hypothetical protein